MAQWVRVIRPKGKIIIIDGKRKRNDETIMARVNRYLWKLNRHIFCGYTGITGRDIELEKKLPYYEGVEAEEVISCFQTLDLKNSKVKNLYELNGILKRNLPGFYDLDINQAGFFRSCGLKGNKSGLLRFEGLRGF